MAIPRQLTAPQQLQMLDRVVEQTSEALQVWEIQFFRPGGKWKYTDYIVMAKPERWTEFDVLINNALRDTPQEIRQTTITDISDWTVVMVNNPYGFPIMVVGKE
ncbi:hypothetical protein SEA_MOLEFICENT_23 [Microbacterium phage Moleficent]|nr:hypothetical protein SEA_MOLEFICENT_23 [Microbacterium phage Moleficent]